MSVLFYFLDARTGPFALLPPPSQAREDQAHCLCLDVDTASGGSWSPPWPWASLESLVQGSLGRHCPLPPPFRPGAVLLQSAWGRGGSLGGRQTGMWPPSGPGSTRSRAGVKRAVPAAMEASSRGGPGQGFYFSSSSLEKVS